MSSFRPSLQSLKMTHVVVAKLLLLYVVFFCVAQDFNVGGVGSDQWIRLCTLTSNGSSLMNVTMPCGVHVRSDEPKDDSKDNTDVSESWPQGDDSVEYVKITLDGGRNTTNSEKQPDSSTTRQDNDSTIKHSNNNTSEDVEIGVEEEGDVKEGSVEEEEEEEEEEGVEEEGGVNEEDVGVEVEDDNDDRDVKIDIGDNDENQSTYDEEVTILDVETNGGASEEREDRLKNRRHGTTVTKVMLGYLLDARNQLYDKIHYLLNLLQRTFFNVKPICRYRRNSIEQRTLLNNKGKQENKRNPSLSSMILEPTFERSIMTMSFLMFGVFITQVVQKLLLMIQHPGETSFMGSSLFGNLPTASSNIF